MTQEQNWLLQDKYNGIESVEFHADLIRLELGVPLAYLIGWVPFCGVKIFLDSHPLIPRPETEYWTMLVIEKMKNINNPKVLDLCAGSGCIGVSVLKHIPDSSVDFVEIDESHYSTIKKNIQENDIDSKRTRIFGGSLFENIVDQYDLILTNPPYINPKLSDRIGESVRGYEPDLALFGGNGGIELINEILSQIGQFLKPGGILYIEHEPEQTEMIKELLPGIRSAKDQFGVIRFSTYQKPT